MRIHDLIPKLELVHEGIPIARVTFGITLFMNEELSQVGPAVIQAHDRFLALVGKDGVRQYATETMRKHKPITPRALSMVKTWFAKGAPKSESYGLELNNAEPFNAAPSTKFLISGWETTAAGRPDSPIIVRYVLPASWTQERISDLEIEAKKLFTLLPFRSGYA